MIKHIVMWNVRGETPAETAESVALLQRSFESLRGRIPDLLHLEIGVDSSRIDYACHVVLYSEFASQAALDAYAIHPEHLRVKLELADIRTARHQVDYESSPAMKPVGPRQQKEASNDYRREHGHEQRTADSADGGALGRLA